MKKTITLSFAFIFVALFAAAALAQPAQPAKPKADETKKEEASSIVAKWDVVIAAPGQDLAGLLKIEKAGDAYKGSLTTDLGEAPMDKIKVDADSFSANITVDAQGQTMNGTITGKLKDGKITGEINLAAFGAIPYSGKKP